MKKDLTIYSDKELSLLSFNTPELYTLIRDGAKYPSRFTLLIDTINEKYIYTKEQYNILLDDISKHYADERF